MAVGSEDGTRSFRDDPGSGAPASAPGEAGGRGLRPGDVVGRYTIGERLGAGGMGVVFLARDPDLERDVAIKVLRPDVGGTSLKARSRFLREAQAMARLSHPNVVAVHDVGTVGDQVFVAMERIAGEPLSEWMKTPRPWREVRDVLVAAGRGLEAAHAVGIVHRDFKPQNVMVGGRRVVVLDFGLARRGDDLPEADDETAPRSPASLDLDLTRTGELLGTPAYMAPEQLAGRAATSLSDQFSFCVTLYQALFGRSPFAARTLAERKTAGGAEPIRPPAGIAPRWLVRLVLRGLAAEPEARHRSMSVLLTGLERDRGRRGGLALLAVGVAAIAGGVLLLRPQRAPVDPCAGAATALGGVWDGAASARLQAAFHALGTPAADEAYRQLAVGLDRYAAAWTAMRGEACAATLLRGEQSPALMDARMQCLDRRRGELAPLVGALDHDLDAARVARAVGAPAGLGSLASCADARALGARVPLPEDPALRRAVATLGGDVDRLRALSLTAPSTFRGEAGGLAAAATAPYAPLRARALTLLADWQPPLAASVPDVLAEAVRVAIAGHDDEAAADAWLALMRRRRQTGRSADALALALPAEEAIVRAGDDPRRRVTLEIEIVDEDETLGRSDDERIHVERALELARALPGPPGVELCEALTRWEAIAENAGDFALARRRVEEALAVTTQVFGPRHWRVGALFDRAAVLDRTLARLDLAAEENGRARELVLGSLGPEANLLIIIDTNRGVLDWDQGRLADARAHWRRAAETLAGRYGPDHPQLGLLYANLGSVEADLGDLAAARADLDRSEAISRATEVPADSSRWATLACGRAAIATRERRFADARRELEKALAIVEMPPIDPGSRIDVLVRLGAAELAAGQRAPAVATLERAVSLAAAQPLPPHLVARAGWGLAQALGPSLPRARALAAAAAPAFVVAGDAATAAAIARWSGKSE